ncbi:MAG TPA: aminoglycoside phosphotransferase family protein [Acidimicrobiales bacterium]|nr:aminoglycoside phosphotransferase family protein [Acidimicrobiales bacterium]
MSILNELKVRQALVNAGVDADGELARAPSVTNEVWMTSDHVVRLGSDKSGRLAREASLATRLPPEVGCPEVVASGREGQLTYIVSRRLAGVPLSQVWARLSDAERQSTVTSLAGRLAALHQVPTAELPPVPDPPQPLGGPDPVAPLSAMLHLAGTVEGVDLLLLAETAEVVRRLRPFLGTFSTDTLIHGDLTFGNVLWHDGEVSGLLDFEFARGAPSDLDLDILLRMCAYPELFVDDDHVSEARAADYAAVRSQLRQAHPKMFDAPRLAERLRLYAIAFTVRELTHLTSIVPGSRQLPGHPQQRLEALIHGTSYLD